MKGQKPQTESRTEKVAWSARIVPVQPGIRLFRSFAECLQDPTLLVNIIGGRCIDGSPDCIQEIPIHLRSFRPHHDLPIRVSGVTPLADSMGNGHREQGVSLLTDRVGMGDRRLLSCPLGNRLPVMFVSENTQRAVIRIIAPLSWLSGLGRPRRPAATVIPQSNGREPSQKMFVFLASSGSYHP